MAENKTMFDRMKELTAGLDEQVTELFRNENLPDFLRTMSHLTGYSLSNILLVHRQRPFSTMLMSFEKWQEQGRNVTRGQKGIQIITPAPYTIEVQRDRLDPRTHAPVLDSSGKPVKETVTQERTTFKISTVFDIDQTYGDQYPAIERASLDRPDVFVDAIQKAAGEPIFIPQRLSDIGAAVFAVQELAKRITGREDDLSGAIEARLAAYTVCRYYDFEQDPGDSFEIAAWAQGKAAPELRESLDTIRRSSHEMIRNIDRNYIEICQERGLSLLPENGDEWSRALINFTDRDGDYQALIDPGADGFAIFQLKQDPALTRIMFMDSDWMARNGQQILLQNYECKYVGQLPDMGTIPEKLEQIFTAFNVDRPQDFKGHSLSVSDVVAVYENEHLSCHYVDKFGFKELTGFLPEQSREKAVPVQEVQVSGKVSVLSRLEGFKNAAPSVEPIKPKLGRDAR